MFNIYFCLFTACQGLDCVPFRALQLKSEKSEYNLRGEMLNFIKDRFNTRRIINY